MYDPNEKNIHLIWSCMTIDQPIKLDTSDQVSSARIDFPFLNSHPHLADGWSSLPNSVYLANKFSLSHFSINRCLTDVKTYGGRAQWRLPICFNQPQAFSYLKEFRREENEVVITYRGYGQEFVMDLDKVVSSDDQQKIVQYTEEIARSD